MTTKLLQITTKFLKIETGIKITTKLLQITAIITNYDTTIFIIIIIIIIIIKYMLIK